MDTTLPALPPARSQPAPTVQNATASTSRAPWVTARIVDAALALMQASGDAALAAALLRVHGVPLHVALRVLTRPDQRRRRQRPCF